MNQTHQPIKPDVTYVTGPAWFITLITFIILLGLLWFGRGFLIPIVVATFY